MPDKKISQLVDGGASQALDAYVIARTDGVNYKIAGTAIAAAATSVGTLTSLTVSGNANFDSGTLYVDAANNRVGVGTATPGRTLSVQDAATDFGPQIAITNTSSSGGAVAGVQLRPDNGTTGLYVGIHRSGFSTPNEAFINQEKNAPLTFYTNNTERMRLDASGNLGLGTSNPSTYASGFLTLSKATASGDTALTIRNAASPVVGGVQGTILNFINDSGATSALAYIQSRSNDGGTGSNGETSLSFGTYNGSALATRMKLDYAGNLGLGTTSPSEKFEVYGGALSVNSGTVKTVLAYAGATSKLGTTTNHPLLFITNDVERARITATGNVGIGTSSPFAKVQISGVDTTFYNTLTVSNGTESQSLDVLCGRALTNGSVGGVADSAVMTFRSSGAGAGSIAFATGNTERARITSGGDLQIGGTNGTYQVNITQSAGDMIRMFRDTSNTVEMFTTSSSTNIFYITVDNSQGVSLTSGNTSWGSYSDARLKNVTGSYTNALSDVAQLEPVKFTWKSDEANKPHVGLLAQSVAPVIPEAVDTDENGMMSVRYTEVIPLLVAAIKELKATNESLEARLAALES